VELLRPDPFADPGRWKRELRQIGAEPLPAYGLALTSALQPLEPEAFDLVQDLVEASGVAVDAEVLAVPVQLPGERGVLLRSREMPVAPAPLADPEQGLAEARPLGLHGRDPVPFAGRPPVEGEAEEIEGTWRRRTRSLIRPTRAGKGNDARLVWVQREPEGRHPLPQPRHHALRVLLRREADDEVIGIADESRVPSQPRAHLTLEPEVERVVQIHVAEQGRDDGPLRRPVIRLGEFLAVQDAHVKTLANESQERPVGDPALEQLHQLLAIDAV